MDLTKIDVPFGELPKETKIALFTAWLDGANVEYYIRGHWNVIGSPSWVRTCKYRLASNKPSIDWSHVNYKYKCLYKFVDGRALLTTVKPVPILFSGKQVGWEAANFEGYEFVYADEFASFKPGNCDWRDSVVMRPGLPSDYYDDAFVG